MALSRDGDHRKRRSFLITLNQTIKGEIMNIKSLTVAGVATVLLAASVGFSDQADAYGRDGGAYHGSGGGYYGGHGGYHGSGYYSSRCYGSYYSHRR